MHCNYKSLYFGNDGYVVRCNNCEYFQVAFMSTLLNLTEQEFKQLYQLAVNKCNEPDYSFNEENKSVILNTDCKKISIILTRKELIRFSEILEEADNEYKAMLLISLFYSY